MMLAEMPAQCGILPLWFVDVYMGRGVLKGLKQSPNLVEQTSLRRAVKIDGEENECPSLLGRMLINCTQPHAALCHFGWHAGAQRSDSAHFAICTRWHRRCKGTPLMAAEWTHVTVSYPSVPNQQALNDNKGYQLNIVLIFTPESGWSFILAQKSFMKKWIFGVVEFVSPEALDTVLQPTHSRQF